VNAGGISAFYFRDPDRHFLEIISFPPGKRSAKWHVPSKDLFLGVDHTVFVVDDTRASLRFYRDTLGMRVAADSENYDVEQEHLSNVFGARLRITALRAPKGPASSSSSTSLLAMGDRPLAICMPMMSPTGKRRLSSTVSSRCPALPASIELKS
jgi:hypothetical protein